MRFFFTFSALFLSVILLQISSAGLGSLDAISGLKLGFSNAQVGLLGSAHFFGFFIGCWWAPRLMGTVGHSRSFAAFTTLGAIGLLAHMLFIGPMFWAILRIATGLCIAGCYTVIEAWMQDKVTNESRGRAMGGYRMVDMGASMSAQLLIGVLEPAHYVSYNILALLCCAAILPLALTRSTQPEVPDAPRLRPKLAISLSPLAAAAVVIAGLTNAAFRMVGPIYGQEVGLRFDQIGLFLGAFVFGGAIAQYPIGWLADKYDRRWILIWLSVAAMVSCGISIATISGGTNVAMLTAMLFGFTTFPIFSVAAAHAHDFASSKERIELSAALMFLYAIGAITSPLIASTLIENYGPASLFAFLAIGHFVLIVFGLSRMNVRDTVENRTPYVYAPRTSFMVGRLFRQQRDKRGR